jgi:hypothetical protein
MMDDIYDIKEIMNTMQVLSLLASAFFCLNPQHKAGASERYRPMNCDQVYASLHRSKAQRSKLLCLLNYFDTMSHRLEVCTCFSSFFDLSNSHWNRCESPESLLHSYTTTVTL